MLRRLLFFMVLSSSIFSQGKVYLVIGSDTGIWQGLDTKKYHHNYNLGLYTDPMRNAFKVMDPAFRNQLVDSYGTPLKMTWWMMSGNTFRHAVNNNIPYANSMTFYLMEKYHGDKIEMFGDEISLHYHTFTWTDYDQDGVYWWNQALHYDDFIEDFEYTLAQNLIDENVFPVSYRSGWHYMDNQWQQYLENILPFSMHNAYPSKGNDTVEPLDNILDWSMAPAEYVPYHPSQYNYQIPGNLKGYELRSIYMSHMNQEKMNAIFQKALEGTDQMVCIWAHLPESDFLENIARIDSLAHVSDAEYGPVTFRYCSAIEAMQRWLDTGDQSPPQATISEETIGDNIYYTIQTDEQIFQDYPFVAVKDIYKRYAIIPAQEISTNTWRTVVPVDKNITAKIGIAVTDLSGNLSTKFINYLPDEKWIDNTDTEYQEIHGNWTASANAAWYVDSRIADIPANDSAVARWSFDIDQSTNYSFFLQVPALENAANSIRTELVSGNQTIIYKTFADQFISNEWIYIGTAALTNGMTLDLNVTALNSGNSNVYFASDVLKITSLIPEIELTPSDEIIDFGPVSQTDTASFNLTLENHGVEDLVLSGIQSFADYVFSNSELPITIPAMGRKDLNVKFFSSELGPKIDTLYLISNDPLNPVYNIPCFANIETPFVIIDNEDTVNYSERGNWSTSVTQAYGSTSRFSYIGQTPRAYADFSIKLQYSGNCNIQMIVPKTVNSSDKAWYILSIGGNPVDSIQIDQNYNSGNWVDLFTHYLPANITVSVKVLDSGSSSAGPVLRADAVKFQMLDGINSNDENIARELPTEYELMQNYPNPFNPTTKIKFSIPSVEKGHAPSLQTKLIIYDILGREVALLLNKQMSPGTYEINFDASNLPSGIYFYRLNSGNFSGTKKMILLR